MPWSTPELDWWVGTLGGWYALASQAIDDAGERGAGPEQLRGWRHDLELATLSRDDDWAKAIYDNAERWMPDGSVNPDSASARSDNPVIGAAQGLSNAGKKGAAAVASATPWWLYLAGAVVVLAVVWGPPWRG